MPERWLRDEYLYHVWHPNIGSSNNDYQGPSDGRGMSARSLESRLIGRVEPCQENPWIRQARLGAPPGVEQLLHLLAEREEPTWRAGQQPAEADAVFMVETNYRGFNLFRYRRHWYALPTSAGYFDPRQSRRYRVLLDGKEMAQVTHLIDYYNGLPKSLWGRLANRPLYQLPWRAARKLGKEIGRLF